MHRSKRTRTISLDVLEGWCGLQHCPGPERPFDILDELTLELLPVEAEPSS
jgi:hypothetical protein